jgi:DHA2 family multidrug resistance protein
LALGLGSLQYILDEGQRNDWFTDPVITTFGVLSVCGLGAFIGWELFGARRPIVDLRAFKYRAIASGSALSFAIGAVLFGAIVILPQYLQGVLGFTATLSGEVIFVRAIFIALFTPFIARFAGGGRVDTRLFLVVGFACVGAGQLWLGYVTTSNSDFNSMLGPAILGGLGLSMLFVPISIAVLSGVPAEVAPKATAFQSLSLQLGGSFSTAALITLLARRAAFHQEVLVGHATAASVPLQKLLAQPGALGQLYRQIVVQATTLSYADCQFALGALTFLLMPLILLMPRRRSHSGPVTAAIE